MTLRARLFCLAFGHGRTVTLYRPTGRRTAPLYVKCRTCLRCGKDVA